MNAMSEESKEYRSRVVDRVASFRDEQLLGFLVDTLLDRQNPVYCSARVLAGETGRSTELLLPSLQVPRLPDTYSHELEQYTRRRNPPASRQADPRAALRQGITATENVGGTIDGVPYNPQDFCFPESATEKEKLSQLAVELGMIKAEQTFPEIRNRKRPVQSLTPLPTVSVSRTENLKERKPRPRAKSRLAGAAATAATERLSFISQNVRYQSELRQRLRLLWAGNRRKVKKALPVHKKVAGLDLARLLCKETGKPVDEKRIPLIQKLGDRKQAARTG